MFTIPAGQCALCGEWKENVFGSCSSCHRFQPMRQKKSKNQMTQREKFIMTATIIKYMFILLKHVHLFVREKFKFDSCDLYEVRNLVQEAFLMMDDLTYKSQEHPDLDLNDLIAAILYKLEVPCNATQFIDDCTLMYGYGKCGSIGDFEFTIAHRFLKPGTTLRTHPTFLCNLKTKQEMIVMHEWKEYA